MARRRRYGSLGTTSLPPGSASLPTMLPRPAGLPAGPMPVAPMQASSQPVRAASPMSPPPPDGERWWKRRKFGAPVWLWGALGVTLAIAILRRKDLAMFKDMIFKPAFKTNYKVGRSAPVDTIVIHATEGAFGGAVQWFAMDHKDPTLKGGPYGVSSAHYTIAKDGRIAQSVKTEDTAYHANDLKVNNRSIGIELEGFPSKDGGVYPPAQMNTLVALVQKLLVAYPTIPRVRGIPGFIGHMEIPAGAKAGKKDPGPGFDWAGFMARIGGNNTPVNIA